MKKIHLIFFLFIGSLSIAQPNWDYTQSIVTANLELGNSIASDTIFNAVYVGGTFERRSAFGFPLGIVNGGSDNGKLEGFLAKYDLAGNLQWAVNIGGTDDDEVIDVAVDPQGFVYVTGYSKGDLSFYSTDLSFSAQLGLNSTDIFIAKYSPSGILQWANVEGGSSKDYGHSVVADNNYVYLSGVYDGIADFSGISPEPTFTGTQNSFIGAYNQGTGLCQWLFEAKSNGNDIGGGEDPHLSRNGLALYDDTLYMMSYMGDDNMRFVNGNGTLLAAPQHFDLNPGGTDLVISAVETTGNLVWTQRIDNQAEIIHNGMGVTADCGGVYICGTTHDEAIFPTIPADTIAPFNHDKAYIAGLRHGTGEMFWHTEFEHSLGGHPNNFYDITADYAGNIYVIGTIDVSPFFSADTTLNTGGFSRTVVLNYENNGSFNWARRSTAGIGATGYGISAFSNQSVFITGVYDEEFNFGGQLAPGSDDEFDNLFLSRLTSVAVAPANLCNCLPPEITVCKNDTTVTADATCNYVIEDYTSAVAFNDYCGGAVVTQSPADLTNLSAGVHQIDLYVTDQFGQVDSCSFDLTIVSANNPIVVSCGETLIDESTFGGGMNGGPFGCGGPSTALGEDQFYQITVPAGNYLIGVSMTNVVDANESDAHIYWVDGGTCPSATNCLFNDTYNISNQTFDSNNQNQLVFNAIGPNTFWFVVDSETDGINEYDLQFDCIVSGVEFDESPCSPNDIDADGVVSTINGNHSLELEPCQNVTVCDSIFIQNVNAGEWMDTVTMSLGQCYTNITNISPNGANTGHINLTGDWNAVYDLPSNSITWGFDHGSGNDWGDGEIPMTNYNCAKYEFCFDATILDGCLSSDSLDISIFINDDGVDGSPPGTAAGFDYASADNFVLIDTIDVGFEYPQLDYCINGSNPIPSVDQPGGVFTSNPLIGPAFNSITGEINLSFASSGNYDITYTSGLCGDDSTFTINIIDEDDASFSYTSTSFCQGDTDPLPASIATPGGTFSEITGNIIVDPSSGLIDLDLSSSGTYWLVYTTSSSGICPNADSIQITINGEDDPTFNYAQINWCENDSDPSPTFIAAPGGTFSEITGDVNISGGSGQVDISNTTIGSFYIVYTTGGVCPNTDSVLFNLVVEDDPFFDYPQTSYCVGHDDTLATNVATPGGTFSEPSGNIIIDPNTGLIDFSACTPGGPYTITYTSPGPLCSNVATFDITITPDDDPTFNYAQINWCDSDSDPSPTFIGSPGGIFSEISGGLDINNNSGQVDISGTAIGSYYAVYTTDVCGYVDSVQFNLGTALDPSFTFAATTYCQGDSDPSPASITTLGGVFSEITGNINVDPSSGLIDLGLSSAGTYWLAYSFPGGCSTADSVQITINPEDDPSFAYTSTSYCETDINPTPVSIATSGGAFSEVSGNIFVNPTTGTIDLNASNAGTYWVVYTTAGLCPNADSIEITVSGMVDPTWTQPNEMCDNEGVIDLSGLISGTIGGAFSGNGVSGNDFDPILSGPGVHDVTYSIAIGNCSDIQTHPITVLASPMADAGADDNICGLDADLIGNTSNGFVQWSNISGAVFNTSNTNENANITAPSYGPHEFYLNVNQSSVCSIEDTVIITFEEAPTANAGIDQLLTFNFETILDADVPTVGVGVWSSLDGLVGFDNINDPITNVNSLSLGENVLTWTVTNGVCPAAVDEMVIVVKDIFIPQAVTPNNDGDNDFFTIHGIENTDASIEIFNRWGQKIFVSDHYENDWRGQNMTGDELPNDTYFYVIVVNNESTYNGYVVLKK